MASKKKAYEFKCQSCGKKLKSGDDLRIQCQAFMSGNTPVIMKYMYFHEDCYFEGANENS